MKKQSISYSDLTKKQLQYLKEFYIQEKVNGMSNEELRNFVLEIISHQINDTIGREEEMEAWQEISDYFDENFQGIIFEIQKKYNEDDSNGSNNTQDDHLHRLDLLEKNSLEKEKKDMWDD